MFVALVMSLLLNVNLIMLDRPHGRTTTTVTVVKPEDFAWIIDVGN